jgi:hypothetical protein
MIFHLPHECKYGILDTDIPTRVIKELGEDTFYQGTLDMVKTPDGNAYAAVPFDG